MGANKPGKFNDKKRIDLNFGLNVFYGESGSGKTELINSFLGNKNFETKNFIITSKKIPEKGETILGDDFVVGPGGKGSNQAVAAAKSGSDVNFISKIGTDPYGELAKKIYKETNVGSKYVFTTDKFNTGVAAILINKDRGDNAISVVLKHFRINI